MVPFVSRSCRAVSARREARLLDHFCPAHGILAHPVGETGRRRRLRFRALLDEPVREVMTRKVVGCREKDTVAEIMERMTAGKFRHLPVLEGDRIVGLISIGDVVKWRVMEFEREQEALQDYIKTA